MSKVVSSVGVLFVIFYAIPRITCTESSFETYNQSLARLLRISEQNMTKFSFYPVKIEFNGKEVGRKYFKVRDESSYILPEPGCSCASKFEDCDFECCYCELGCPLAKGMGEFESWLNSMYGNMCKDRRKHGYKQGVAPTFSQRREKISERIVLSCDRPNHPINGRMPSFQFICVHADNSYTSFQYELQPSNLNLIRLTNLTPMKYSWPILQAFYNNCHHLFEDPRDKAININEPESLPDEHYLLLLRVSQLFHLEPPPFKFTARGKDHLNNYKMCLSYRENEAEILGSGWKPDGSMRSKQNPVDILEKAISNLARQKVNYLVNFQPKMRGKFTSCNELRNFMTTVSRVWIQQIKDFAHAYRSDTKTTIPSMKHMEAENLSLDRRWETGLENESFPEKCHNVAVGLEVDIYFSWESINEIRDQMFTRDVSATTPMSFFIQLKTLSPPKRLTTNLSSFWSDFVLYECPDQYCWRDIFDFSQLPAQPVVVVLTFIFMPTVSLLLFSKVGFYELI